MLANGGWDLIRRLKGLRDSRHIKALRLSALRTGRLYPQEIFLVLISVRGWVDPEDHSAAGRIVSMKTSNETVGKRTRDLLASSALSVNGGYIFFYFNRYSNTLERVPSVSDSLTYQFAHLSSGIGRSKRTPDSMCLFAEEWMLEIGPDMWVWRYGKYPFWCFCGSDRCQIQFACCWEDTFERRCGHLSSVLVVVGRTKDCIPWRVTRETLGTLHNRGTSNYMRKF